MKNFLRGMPRFQTTRRKQLLIEFSVRRRQVLGGLVACFAAFPRSNSGQAQTASGLAAIHFTRSGRNDGDGSSWQNAAPFDLVGSYTSEAMPGQTILIGVPRDERPLAWSGQQIQWNAGGTAGAPLQVSFGGVSGQDGVVTTDPNPSQPVFQMVGHETAQGERPNVGGAPFIVLGSRSSNVSISGPSYDRSGARGFFRFDAGGRLRNLAFSNVHARRAGRVIDTDGETAIEGLRVENCTAIGLIRGFARFHELSDAQFVNLDLDADFMDGGGNAVCQIIRVAHGSGLLFSNLRLAKAVNPETGSNYIQGDGLVLEEGVSNVRIDNVRASDMGDGGFDLKAEHVHMIQCTTTRCKYGMRIWSHHPENLIEACQMTDPVTRRSRNQGSCLWLAGNLTARNCTMHSTGDMSPIRLGGRRGDDRQATLRIQGGQIRHAREASLITGSAGHVEFENVMVNGTEMNGRFYWTGEQLQRR